MIAVAGGADKCRWLEAEGGADVAVDYRTADLPSALKAAAPGGVDIFFDNVGGEILQTAVDRMAPHGRIVLCGQISAYDTGEPAAGPRDMMKLVYGRIRMEGFLVGDYADRYDEAIAAIRGWTSSGRLTNRYDLRAGFDILPGAFVDIFEGRNSGTLLVSLY